MLLPLAGAALGALGALLYPHYWAIAIVWAVPLSLPLKRDHMVILAAMIAVRWLLLDTIPQAGVWAAYIAIQTVPRAALIAIAWTSRPAGLGAAHQLCSTLSTRIALPAVLMGAAAAFAVGVRCGLLMILGNYILIRAIRWLSYRRSSGIDGYSLVFTQTFSELLCLWIAGCLFCRL